MHCTRAEQRDTETAGDWDPVMRRTAPTTRTTRIWNACKVKKDAEVEDTWIESSTQDKSNNSSV